jgi:nitrogen regulatory protein PII
MKKIEAIVRASRFDQVKEALSTREINFFTFYEVKGYGHERGKNLSYRGAIYDVGYIARIKIEIIVTDDFVDAAKAAIVEAAKTGEKGDGLIYVSDLDSTHNIRTGNSGSDAINS